MAGRVFQGVGRNVHSETYLPFNDTKLQNPGSSAVGGSIGGRVVTVGLAVMFPSHCECTGTLLRSSRYLSVSKFG